MSTLPPLEVPDLPTPQGAVSLVIVSIVFNVLAVAAVVFRIWSRRIQKVKLRLNDYASFLALVFSIGQCSDYVAAALLGGAGLHLTELGIKEILAFSKAFFAAEFLWAAANCAVKVSILHLYMTIFRGPRLNMWCYIFISLSAAYFIMIALEGFLLCMPVAKNWDSLIPGTCANQKMAYLFAGIVNLILDVGIITLPIPVLWRLQMPFGRKLSIAAMFGLGIFIVIITIIRINSIQSSDIEDITYVAAGIAIWSVLEPSLGIVNCCLPVMRPAFKKIFSSPAFAWTHKSQEKTPALTPDRGHKRNVQGKSFGKRTNSSSGRSWHGLGAAEDVYSMVSHAESAQGSQEHGTGPGAGRIEITTGWEVLSAQRSHE